MVTTTPGLLHFTLTFPSYAFMIYIKYGKNISFLTNFPTLFRTFVLIHNYNFLFNINQPTQFQQAMSSQKIKI